MPKLQPVSGKVLVSILIKEGFVVIRQKGSHTRLVLVGVNESHYITIPLHKELDRGTLKSIMRSLKRCFEEEKLLKLFYK